MYDRNEPVFADYRYESGNLSVEWEFIGEGHSGDYNAEDPEDEPLLRANLMVKVGLKEGKSAWMQPSDASYCTFAVVDTPKVLLDDASYLLIQAVRDNGGVTGDGEFDGDMHFQRKVMEHWTWTSYDVQNDKIEIPRDNPYFKNAKYIRER